MKYLLPTLLVVSGFATSALADSPFDGKWKADLAAAKPSTKPDVLVLANGSYECKTCLPPIKLPADGKLHPLSGHDYFDAMMIKVVDSHTVAGETSKGGKVQGKVTMTVSADGRTLTRAYTDMSASNGAAVSGSSTETRVSAGPAGSHAISGSWRQNSDGKASDASITFTVETHGNTIRIVDGMGDDVTGRFGGGYVLTKGDPGKTMSKFERLGPRTLRETDMRGGKVVGISTISISADGKTLTNISHDPRDNTTGTYYAHKVS